MLRVVPRVFTSWRPGWCGVATMQAMRSFVSATAATGHTDRERRYGPGQISTRAYSTELPLPVVDLILA